MRNAVGLVLFLVACTPGIRDDVGVDAGMGSGDRSPDAMAAAECAPPPNPAGSNVELAAPYNAYYTAYDLGAVPGVPNALGGTVVSSTDPNKLLVAGGSEAQGGAIYSIGLTRDGCGHITGFNGTATKIASTPYVDANLVYLRPDLLLYTEWPQYQLSQLAGNASAPSRRTDLRTLGMPSTNDSGAGGLGLVPLNLPAANQLRAVTWPGGQWFHVGRSPDGNLVKIDSLNATRTLPNQPGGFAYVPAGSPGFAKQSLIVSEWHGDTTLDRVAVYDVDDQGDPVIATRKEFFSKFPHPYGAYFEPTTGDYLFLSWGSGNDHVYIVQGFVPPVLQ